MRSIIWRMWARMLVKSEEVKVERASGLQRMPTSDQMHLCHQRGLHCLRDIDRQFLRPANSLVESRDLQAA